MSASSSSAGPAAPSEGYLKEMHDKMSEILRKGEELDRREAALEQKVEQLAKATAINHQTSASLAKSVA
eukprot:15115278-Alexandrium_andersonii.AAC.1